MNAKRVVGCVNAPLYLVPMTWDETKALQVNTTELLRAYQVNLARNKYEAVHGHIDPSKPDKWYIDLAIPPGDETKKKYIGRGAKLVRDARDSGEDFARLRL